MAQKGDLLHVAVGDHQMSSCGDGVISMGDLQDPKMEVR